MSHFNKLTPAEAERLAMLAEEAAEVIQVVGKILRHGYENFHPDTPSITNRELLAKEIVDFQSVADKMFSVDDIPFTMLSKHWCGDTSSNWVGKLKWTHHQGNTTPTLNWTHYTDTHLYARAGNHIWHAGPRCSDDDAQGITECWTKQECLDKAQEYFERTE